MGSLSFRLGRKLAAYKREYPPPTRVRPLPISVLHTLETAAQGGTNRQQAIANPTWITFFSLLRLGEYCQGGINTVYTPC